MRIIAATVIVASYAACAMPASAATITVLAKTDGVTLVGVDGDLTLEDGEKFATLVRPLTGVVVMLNSDGGNLFAGLRIGQITNARNFATLVPDGGVCASACALAWVGGARRYLGPKARLGFHAAYIANDGATRVSGSGNALVGAYLDRLGLSNEAIFELTDAAPDDIHWLDVAGANRLGIATREFRMDDVATPTVRTPAIAGGPAQRARSVADAYFAAGSSDASTALTWLGAHYAQLINFYGKPTPIATVLQQKQVFVTRWPERVYIPVGRTVTTLCSPDGQTCRISGEVQYECRSYARGAYSAGLATFALTIDLAGPEPVVTEEAGRVLERR